MNKERLVIYPAASLFSSRETYFNSKLVEGLEKLGYKTNFLQRDGFEFGNLAKTLSDKLEDNKINSAVQNIIYFLDMGVFIPKSDIILVNSDEPLDSGIDIEASYGKLMSKFVIGFRTDVRSPYGSINDKFQGMHFFPAMQSNIFIHHYMPYETSEQRDNQMNLLINKIHQTIVDSYEKNNKKIPNYVMKNPHFRNIFNGAKLLFNNINDIYSNQGFEKITLRYIKDENILEKITPKVL